MQWSLVLGRVAGIEVRVHLTFLFLLVWIGVSHYIVGGTPAAVTGLLFILLIFGSVLLHEFGHALAARRYGVKTPDITLLPIGGVARIEKIPDEPKQELVVAVAGPLVNVAIAAVLMILLSVINPATLRSVGVATAGFFRGDLITRLIFVNLWLVLFNLIPAFPMDGGRVLRALLATRLGFARATRIAAGVGQAFAFLFVLAGFFINPFLIFIGLFVYMGAAGEVPAADMREFARDLPVASVMVTRFQPFRRDTPLSEAVRALLSGADKEFPVVDDDGRVVGLLCREDIVKALSQKGADTSVGDAMQTEVPTARDHEMLEGAFHRLVSGRYAALPVINFEGRLVGLLTRENVAEVMMIRNAGLSQA